MAAPNDLPFLQAVCDPHRGGRDTVALLVVLGIFSASYAATHWLRTRKGKPEMKWKNAAIVATLLLAVAAVFALKSNRGPSAESAQPAIEAAATGSPNSE